MKKSVIGLIGSALLTFIGVVLRLKAHVMVVPGNGYSYSGPYAETDWGRQELAISQIGMALMFAGILIFVVTYFYWLFGKQSEK
jgi:hypothetical protein